jgi:hypothetical protein
MARQSTWTNSDGLKVGFGTRSDNDESPGVLGGRAGARRTLVCEIDVANLVDTFAAANRTGYEAVIPRGSIITAAYLNTVTAVASSGGGTLEIGTWGTNDSVDDADGIVATVAVAELNAVGEVHICDGALVAAPGNTAAAGIISVGATANSDCIIAPSWATAAFQSGVVQLTVEYIAPTPSAVAN